MCQLIQKYNVAGPRYTSYPTVPYWNIEDFSGKNGKLRYLKALKKVNRKVLAFTYIFRSVKVFAPFADATRELPKGMK